MNKVYRIIWSNVLNQWVVVSEVSKARGKSRAVTNLLPASISIGRFRPLAMALFSLLSINAYAAPICSGVNCTLDAAWNYNLANSNAATVIVDNGLVYNIIGPTSFNSATSNATKEILYNDAVTQGYVTQYTHSELNGKPLLSFGNKNNTITYTDPVSGQTISVDTYHSASISSSPRDPKVTIIDPAITSAPYYFQAGFVKVTYGSAVIDSAPAKISGHFKDTQLASAISNNGQKAKVTWRADTTVEQYAGVVDLTETSSNTSYNTYKGIFVAYDQSVKTVDDVAGLQAYNSWLIAEITAGRLTGSQYTTELNRAYGTVSSSYKTSPILSGNTPSDPILSAPIGKFAVLYGMGKDAEVELTGSLKGTVRYTSALTNALVLLEDGANGINRGRISSGGFGYGTVLKSGSTFHNYGVVDNEGFGSFTYLIRLVNAGTHYMNEVGGVVNLAPAVTFGVDSSYGFMLYDNSKLTNNGVMNFSDAARANPGRVYGVSITASSAHNNGTMTLGQLADGTPVNTSAESVIFSITSSGTETSTNSGHFILGAKNEGTTGARVGGKFINTATGLIDILGEKSATSAVNIGIHTVNSAATAQNAGTINVQGTNNIGIKASSQSKASSSGVINVVGKQTVSNLNNYGVWAENTNSQVSISGTINLTGDNVIAVHARDGGTINLESTAKLIFNNGTKQVGYYIHGANAKLNNNATAAQNVTSADSTLMRLDAGAKYIGTTTTVNMAAEGAGSTILWANGKDSAISSGKLILEAKGKNAMGVKVTGGATGTLTGDATIALAGEGSIAAIVDGLGYNLAGGTNPTGDDVKKLTTLTTHAALTSALDKVIGYQAGNMATLVNTGNISFTGKATTAIVVNSGASAKSSGNISITGDNSAGIDVSGVGSQATVTAGTLTLSGTNSKALWARSGGAITVESGAQLVLANDQNILGLVENAGSKITNIANVTASAGSTGVTAFKVRDAGILVNSGTINLALGTGHTAVNIAGGTVTNTGTLQANGTALYITGANSVINNSGLIEAVDGNAAIELGANASLDIGALTAAGMIRAKNGADGILLSAGATSLTVANAKIDLSDPSSTGIGINNVANIAGIQLNNTEINVRDGVGIATGATLNKYNSGTINVGGGIGLLYQKTDGSAAATNNALDLSESSGLTINVAGAGGQGIVANTTGNVTTAVNVNILDSQGGAALSVTEAATIIQQGALISKAGDVLQAGKATIINNSGIIAAGNQTLKAVVVDGASDIVLTNSGTILGQLDFVAGSNTVNLEKTSKVTGNILLGTGSNNQVIASGSSLLTGNITVNGSITKILLNDTASITGTIAVVGSGNELTVATGASLGHFVGSAGSENSVTLIGNSGFTTLDAGTGGANDRLTFIGKNYTLANNADMQRFDVINLQAGSNLTTGTTLLMGDSANSTGIINIDATSQLTLAPAADYTLIHALSGKGLVEVVSGDQFDFAATTGDHFAGTVKMNSSAFNLAGANTAALTNATLRLMGDNTTTVATGKQSITGLDFAGGTLKFGVTLPGAAVSDAFVAVKGTLDLSKTGQVQVNKDNVENTTPPIVNTTLGLLDQQNETFLQLGSAVNVLQGGAIELIDANGAVISNASSSMITQNGVDAALGYYDYRITGENLAGNTGLYVAYGLKQLELLSAGDDKLVIDPSLSVSKTLTAQVTGDGDLGINAGSGRLTISNLTNNYRGATDVQTGTLVLGSDNALGNSRALLLATNTRTDLNGKTQTLGALMTQNQSVFDFNGGALSLTNGGQVSGRLQGTAGTLDVQGGSLAIEGANIDLNIAAKIASSAQMTLNHHQALGASTIDNEGVLALIGVNGAVANKISGTKGSIVITQSSDLSLSGDNRDFSGTIRIDNGSALAADQVTNLGSALVANSGQLTLDVTNTAPWDLTNAITGTGTVIKKGLGVLSINTHQAYSGETTIEQGRLIVQADKNGNGTLASQRVNILEGAELGGYGSVAGDVYNAGALLVGSQSGNSGVMGNFTVQGNYIGQGGTIVFGTVLGNDHSATDHLTIAGNSSGNSTVIVHNVRGVGAQTTQGIELIDIEGQSNGHFELSGRAIAGAYEYRLAKDANGHWYLRSETSNGSGNGGQIIEDGNSGYTASLYRPEVGGYLANIESANTLFSHQLTDRMQKSMGPDGRATWIRVMGDHGKSTDTTGQLRSTTNNKVLQVGGDIIASPLANDGLIKFGAMFGYGHTQSSTRSHETNARTKASGDGYAVGLYGTWFQHSDQLLGAYVDSWIQYVHFENRIKGNFLREEGYTSKGLLASIEAGYTFKLGTQFYLQPQAQLTWMDVKADDHYEYNGTKVRSGGQGNIRTRLGVRAFGEFELGKQMILRPYAELNWLHNTKRFYVDMDGTQVNQRGARDIGQVKVGLSTQLNSNMKIWGDISHDVGKNSYRKTKLSLSFSYHF